MIDGQATMEVGGELVAVLPNGSSTVVAVPSGQDGVVVAVNLKVPIADATLHHAGFVRTFNEPLRPAVGDWRTGTPSPLVGELHLSMELGEAPFGLYPPLVVFAQNQTWLIGPISQNVRRVLWRWKEDPDGDLTVEATLVGESESSVREVFFIQHWDTPRELTPDLFHEYNHALGQAGCGRTPLPGVTWATWNDGVFRDIDQERILRTADFLREEFTNVRWIQVDDGWAGPLAAVPNEDGTLGMSDFACFYKLGKLEGDARIPGGMKHLADEIRARGFRPMIWLTPSVDYRSELFQDHPDWFQPDLRLHFVPEMRFLDLSVPEARDYVQHVFRTAFGEWGYGGCKLDFWSMGFEQPDATSRLKGKSSVEWERWFLDELRSAVGEDGLLLHCIDLPFGTPFRSRWFDNFRLYADSEGICAHPEMMKEQARWTAYLTALYGVQRFWTPNADGYGTFPHIGMPANTHRLWGAFLLGSGSVTELAGWLAEVPDREAVERVRLVAEWASPGAPVSVPGYDFAEGSLDPPAHWVRGGAAPLVALTNWGAEPLRHMVGSAFRGLFSGRTYTQGEIVEVPAGDGEVLVPLDR